MLFINFEHFPSTLNLLRDFIIYGCCVKCFFPESIKDHMLFLLYFVVVVDYLYQFSNVKLALQSWDQPHRIMMHCLFSRYCWIGFAKISTFTSTLNISLSFFFSCNVFHKQINYWLVSLNLLAQLLGCGKLQLFLIPYDLVDLIPKLCLP